MSFNVNFFDGKSSRVYKASVIINSTNWSISYVDEFLITKTISWTINEIQKPEVYTKGLVAFKYGESFPFQKIESSDEQFIKYINRSEHKNITSKVDNWLHKFTSKSIVLLLSIIIGAAFIMYFYVIPAVAVNFAEKLPKERVVDFGNYVFRVLLPNLKIDEEQTKNLQSFVDAMSLDSEFPLKVYVAKSKELNAFALSGGKFVIYTGLLKKIKTEHQLASLIGHEISHIEKRHVLKGMARNLSGAIFVSILFGDVSGVTAVLGENAHKFSQMAHSRALETEADIFGLEIVSKNNLDQHGMPELFQILKDETPINVPSFLSTHPILEDRIKYTQKIADEQKGFQENLVLKEKWNVIKSSFSSDKQDNL